jgi:antitoxin HicB
MKLRGPMMNYRVLIFQDEDGFIAAECPSLPGCITQGKTIEEVKENIQDAICGYLESLKKHNEPIPPSIEEEIVEEVLFNLNEASHSSNDSNEIGNYTIEYLIQSTAN